MPDEIPACPRCEITDESVYIDLEVDEMTVEADKYVEELLEEFRTIGVAARIGIAPSRFVSFVAAHSADPVVPCVVPQDKTESFLSSQNVSLLPILPETLRRLKRLGIQKFGEVASIASRDLINQFGKEAALMADLVRGIDPTPPNFLSAANHRGSHCSAGKDLGRRDATQRPLKINFDNVKKNRLH